MRRVKQGGVSPGRVIKGREVEFWESGFLFSDLFAIIFIAVLAIASFRMLWQDK